ncbi:mechanosensitive ion channel family protein [Erysipelothrix rhusiopathiae]|uniref:mechanosensitive ion channel family protein n=1 Tax=Erysipelothrix rhusiopathiae TaxID=1648 RepID=UPI003F657A85
MENIILFFEKPIVLRLISIALTLLIVFVIVRVIRRSLIKIENKVPLGKQQRTVYPIISRTLVYVVYFIAFIIILETIGLDTKPILAVTSIGSVAVGFGAQQLVKDVINGFSILSENQFNVGDVVSLSDVTGTVEDITLRTTRLRNGTDGKVYIIPNGEIKMVTNMSKEYMFAVVNVPVPYDKDLDTILEVLNDTVKHYQNPGSIMQAPVVQGVTEYEESSLNIRITCKTYVGKNWAVERDLRRVIIYALEAHDISLPFPTRTVYVEQDLSN